MCVLLFFLVAYVSTKTCNISEPILSWLEKHQGPCDTINGHFILDTTAINFTIPNVSNSTNAISSNLSISTGSNYTNATAAALASLTAANYYNDLSKKLLSAFTNLTKIEGCIKVRGSTGLQNFSYFSKLKVVICHENKAKAVNLTNVIDLEGKNLITMGLSSLHNVTGPGEIRLSLGYIKGTIPCFSKEELLFLAYHHQFRGQMYDPCDMSDPCFHLEQYVKKYNKTGYNFRDILPNCTLFFGSVAVKGSFNEEYVMGRFDNLTVIIGELHIGATLLDRLDRIFPKLEIVYPYFLTDIHIMLNFQSVQFVHAKINRFLTNWSIPTLKTIRPLDIGNTLQADDDYGSYFSTTYSNLKHMNTFLPDTIPDPCAQFPQFNGNCGSFITQAFLVDGPNDISTFQPGVAMTWSNLASKCFPYEGQPTKHDCVQFLFNYETYVLSIVSLAAGSLFSFRAMLLLIFSKAKYVLSHSGLLLFLIIFITTINALENSLVYEKPIRFLGPMKHFLPQFETVYLFHPLFQKVMTILVASKHACLPVIVLCHLLILLCSRPLTRRLSKYFCALVLFGFPIVAVFLHSHIHLAIRGVRPLYASDPRQLTFIPFIMNINFAERFNQLFPESMMIIHNRDDAYYSPVHEYEDSCLLYDFLPLPPDFAIYVVDFPFESFGQLGIGKPLDAIESFIDSNVDLYKSYSKTFRKLRFPSEYTSICDLGMLIVSVSYFVFRRAKLVRVRGYSEVLVLLLSMNRIRFFLHDYILGLDFCNNLDYGLDIEVGFQSTFYITCYDAGEMKNLYTRELGFYKNLFLPSTMTRYEWDIIERVFEMLPYVFFLFVSYVCYEFARFHSYLGTSVYSQQIKKAANGNLTSTFATKP